MATQSDSGPETVTGPSVDSPGDSEEGAPRVRVGIISGTGTTELSGLEQPERTTAVTAYGAVDLATGRLAGIDIVHLSRHGPGHIRLSNNVDHRANLSALLQAEVDCLISLTVCGAVRPDVGLGSLVVFDDLYFPSNRLADGSLCTWYHEAGHAERGHWIFDHPFSETIRSCLIEAAGRLGLPTLPGGCYGHVDGPRFNSRAEIAALAAAGVTAVSQSAGPEVVLAGEAELPIALVGYLTDYANGVQVPPEPVDALLARVTTSTGAFASVLEAALPMLDQSAPAGTVYRFRQ
jgi:5'-methylthioadenosine phosphorylase